MFKKVHVTIAVLSAGLMMAATDAGGHNCEFDLRSVDQGSVRVSINRERLRIKIRDAEPNKLYTVWVDFRSRANGRLSNDYPDEAIRRGVAPAFATTAGVTEGMGLDQNGMITDDRGRAELRVDLDYNLLERGDTEEQRGSPVVGDELARQGPNRVGGYWLRVYEEDSTDSDAEASLQVTDPDTGLPLVQRATAQGLTIVRHPDFVTHGHTPGVAGVDHVTAYFGDFPDDCRED